MVFGLDAQDSTPGSGTSVTTTLSTTAHPTFVGAFVAWSGAFDIINVTDTGSHTWTKKGPTTRINKVNGVVLSAPISVAYFYTIALANLGAVSIVAHFNGSTAHNVISVFAVDLAKVNAPFDTNTGLGTPGIRAISGATGYSVPFSTHLNHFFAVAFAILFADPSGENPGAGWTGLNTGGATDFGWIAEYKLFSDIQTDTPVPFITTSGTYTAITIIDAILAKNATEYPWKTFSEGKLTLADLGPDTVDGAVNATNSVWDKQRLVDVPIIQEVVIDQTPPGPLIGKVIVLEQHNSKKDWVGEATSEWNNDSTTTVGST